MSALAPARDPGPDRPTAARDFAYKWAIGIAAAALQSLVYFALGYLERTRSATLLALPLDRWIPFWVWTVWLYLPFYAGIFAMAITGLRRGPLFNRALQGFLITLLIGALGHLIIAAEYPRPPVPLPHRGPSDAFLAWVQAVDPPGNVFPSLHVAHTSGLAFILRHERPRLGAVAIVMALLLALSTLTTKQHFVLDVLSGWVIAFLISRWVLRPFCPRPPG
jgi:membrane-associated phospholipid phosphatase